MSFVRPYSSDNVAAAFSVGGGGNYMTILLSKSKNGTGFAKGNAGRHC